MPKLKTSELKELELEVPEMKAPESKDYQSIFGGLYFVRIS